MLLKDPDSLLGATHITPLSDEFAPLLYQCLRLVLGDFILRRRWERHIHVPNMLPRSLALHILELVFVAVGAHQLGQLLALDLEISDISHLVWADSLLAGGNDCAFAVREGDNGCAKLDGFEGGVLGYVSGSGDCYLLAFEGFFAARGVLDHVLDVLHTPNQRLSRYCQGTSGRT